MKFKRIEIYGFKSFADKHAIPFGDGVTAIVGPNGCGKSNVADSVRWVLGEQSAKLLRGTSMQDVIFNGTEKRKSISYCEVALVFDNKEQLFPSLDYDEVVISRKLYRSGESEYAINRTPCRLKDITEQLREAGMGREGYSIIGQGRIEQLLSAKPEDRRAIFEEAAGIAAFKAKKQDSERKLMRTGESLVRINDILDEKKKQLDPLTRQAESARRWLAMRDELKLHEINTYIYQHETAAEAKSIIQGRLDGIVDALAFKQKSHEEAGSSYNESMYNLNSIGRTIDTLREELLQLTVDMEKLAGDRKVLNERMKHLIEQSKTAAAENAELDNEYKQTVKYVEDKAAEIELRTKQLSEISARTAEIKEQYLAITAKLSEGEGSAQSNQAALLEAMDRLAEIQANLSRLTAEREGLAHSVKDLAKRTEFILSGKRDDDDELALLLVRIAEMESRSAVVTDKLQALTTQGNEQKTLQAAAAEALDRVNEKYFTAASRRKMLNEMQQAYEGFANSIRNLMNSAAKDKEIDRRIQGVVAQVISVDQAYETAIETALGGAMQNIITKDEDDAKYLIEYLKKRQFGRVTFLPITSFKPRSIDRGYRALLSSDGCCGVASELVRCDKKFQSIIDGLLGATVVARDMTAAIALAKKSGYGFRIVTLDGEIINPSGAITGGSRKNDIANIFSHERELKELNVLVDELSAKVKQHTAERDAAAKKMEEIGAGIQAHSAESRALAVETASANERRAQLSESVTDAERMHAELQEEAARATARIAEIDADLGSVTELENTISEKKQLAKLSEAEFSKISGVLKAQRDELSEQLSAARIEEVNGGNYLDALKNEVKRIQEKISDLLTQIEFNNELIASNEKKITEIEREISAVPGAREGREGDEKRIAEIREKLAGLDEYKEQLQEKIAELDRSRQQLFEEIQNLSERRSREEMLLQKVDFDIEQFELHIREEYELEYRGCLEFKQEGYDATEGTKEIARLKRSMSSLGNINVDAIELSQQVFEEYQEMDIQRNDLEKASADLTKMIEEMSKEMLARFNTEFEKIRQNFVKTFKELFNGGTADLILLENENPLEAGVEIIAQPPEKKRLSISLLSGGERALTAIAILFSILKLKPMPFCLLDEIEAALDDANAQRFAKYLRRFSQDTQFIVITHRKPTMELADNLYGVTMEEKGVSKIVSVKLSEAASLADQGTANTAG